MLLIITAKSLIDAFDVESHRDLLKRFPRGVYVMSWVLGFMDWFVHPVLRDKIVELSSTYICL